MAQQQRQLLGLHRLDLRPRHPLAVVDLTQKRAEERAAAHDHRRPDHLGDVRTVERRRPGWTGR
jgi:hypothetical protein